MYSAAQWQLHKRTRATHVRNTCETRHACTHVFTADAHLQTGHVLNVSHYFRLWSLVKAVFSSVYAQRLSHVFLALLAHTCPTRAKCVRNACDTRAIVKLPLSRTVGAGQAIIMSCLCIPWIACSCCMLQGKVAEKRALDKSRSLHARVRYIEMVSSCMMSCTSTCQLRAHYCTYTCTSSRRLSNARQINSTCLI